MIDSFTSQVRYSETDEKGLLSIPSLINYFQDTSAFQAEKLGIGIGWLKSRNTAWILSSWQIDILRRPALGETVTARTWAYDFHGFFGMRNFDLHDGEGKLAARANSCWILFDFVKGRPVKVFPELTEAYGLHDKIEMEYLPRKLQLPEGGEVQETFLIGRQYLDTNHHVNNGQYIAMAASCLPEGFEVGSLRAEYRRQALLGDTMAARVIQAEDGIGVSLENEQGEPYALVLFGNAKKEA